MLLIHSDQAAHCSAMDEQRLAALMSEYEAFHGELEAAGARLASHRLQPTTSAVTVRVRERELLTTDGPFAETKEQFGGYYLVDVASEEEAIRWAAKIPSATFGSVEVRPLWTAEGGCQD
jgi:hypothetical protein